MTGLDVLKDKIMEVACLVTDSNLNIVAESPPVVIQQPSIILDNMNEWCQKQHGQVSWIHYIFFFFVLETQDILIQVSILKYGFS